MVYYLTKTNSYSPIIEFPFLPFSIICVAMVPYVVETVDCKTIQVDDSNVIFDRHHNKSAQIGTVGLCTPSTYVPVTSGNFSMFFTVGFTPFS